MNRQIINNTILIIVVVFISVIFMTMIRNFLMVILLAGIFSAMAQPLFRFFNKLFKNKKNLTSFVTLVFIFLIILLPLLGLAGIVADQAIRISQSVRPWIEQQLNQPSPFDKIFQSLPYAETINQYRDVIIQRGGELIGKLSNLFFNSLSQATVSTFKFVFLFFIFLYTMFFFLKEGDRILNKILYYLPLTDQDEQRMLDKFTSVTRATIKGTLVIGIIQGSLAGVAFWVVGIDSALFWGTLMTVLSIIPAVGSALVWLPAAIILAASGEYFKAVGLAAFCGLLVGSVDNILRPRLVGRDTKMHELLILFSTLGGITFFGVIGFIVGPIIAALFVTVWDIYGETFKDYLPTVNSDAEEASATANPQADNQNNP